MNPISLVTTAITPPVRVAGASLRATARVLQWALAQSGPTPERAPLTPLDGGNATSGPSESVSPVRLVTPDRAAKTPAAKTTAPAAKKTSAKKTAAKKTPAKKTATTQTPAAKTTAPPAKKTSAKKTAAKKTPAKKSAAKKASATKTPAKKATATKSPTKKAPAETIPETPAVTKATSEKAAVVAPALGRSEAEIEGDARRSTEPLLDPATAKAVATEAATLQRAADPDKG